MLHDHPNVDELIAFLRGKLQLGSRGGNAGIVRHLLGGCPICQRRLQNAGWPQERLLRLIDLPAEDKLEPAPDSPAAKSEYDAAFSKAERTLSAFFDQGKPVEQPPQELMAELFPLLSEDKAGPISRERREAIPQLVKWLIQRSQSARYEDPERMLHWSHMARLAVDACSAEIAGGDRKLADLRGQAWRQFGNSLRVCGRLDEAEEAMAVARTGLQSGTGDPLLWALFLNQIASLRIGQRQFEGALQLLTEAEEIYKDMEESHELAATLVQKAVALNYSAKPEGAVGLLEQAIPLINEEEDLSLLLAARHNMVRSYLDMGQPQKALSCYFEIRELNKQFQDPLIQLRVGWQEGQLLRDLGHLPSAEERLLGARKGFMERGLAYEVAVLSLDLAEVYSKMGRVDEVNQLVSEMVPIFRALRIGRDMLATLIQLRQTVQKERQTSEVGQP